MDEVQRICPQCAASGPLGARYCAACGYDFQGALPAKQSALPVVLSRAAVPILVGAASVALRIGWKVLQSRWAQTAAERAATKVVDAAIHKVQPKPEPPVEQPPAPRQVDIIPSRPRRTVTIRSAWSVGDTNGVWRHGYSEHRIDLDD